MTNEYLQSIIDSLNHDDPYNEANRIHAAALEEGRSVVEVTLLPEHKNIWGLPHGGILFAAADVAAGIAADSVREGMHIVTAGRDIHFLYANPDAKMLRAEGRVIRAGKRIIVVEANVYDEFGHHLVTGQFTMYDAQ